MDTLKEIVIDALILVGAWLVVTASGLTRTAEGFSCGRAEAIQEVHP
jgi:hypothetical protein